LRFLKIKGIKTPGQALDPFAEFTPLDFKEVFLGLAIETGLAAGFTLYYLRSHLASPKLLRDADRKIRIQRASPLP
jgi:hypothetical protein